MRKGRVYVDPMLFDPTLTDPITEEYIGSDDKPLDISALILGIASVIAAAFIPVAAYPCGVVGLIYCARHKRRKRITLSLILCIIGIVTAAVHNVVMTVYLTRLLERLAY